MKTPVQVPVFSRTGTRLGQVGQTVTSVGASKIAGGPVEYSGRFGVWGWVAKQGDCDRPPVTRLPPGTAHGLERETVGDLIYRQHGGGGSKK